MRKLLHSKANYYGGLSHLIGQSHVAGQQGALCATAISALQPTSSAREGGQWATEVRGSGQVDRLESSQMVRWDCSAPAPPRPAPPRPAGPAQHHPARRWLWQRRRGGRGGGEAEEAAAAQCSPHLPAQGRTTATYTALPQAAAVQQILIQKGPDHSTDALTCRYSNAEF